MMKNLTYARSAVIHLVSRRFEARISRNAMLVTCLGCAKQFQHLGRHLGKSAKCRAQYYAEFDSDEEEDVGLAVGCVAEHWDEHYQRKLDAEVFVELSELVFKLYLGKPAMDTLCNAIERWVDFGIVNMRPDLRKIIGHDEIVDQIERLMRKRLNFFSTLRSEFKLTRYAQQHIPVLHVVENVVGTGPGMKTYGVLVLDWILSLLRYSAVARKDIVARSELWKSGAMLEEFETISNWDQGTTFKSHPFAQPHVDAPGEPILVRALIGVGYDDLEALNALGVSRGLKKLACFYGSCFNLRPELRFDHDYIAMLLICLQKLLQDPGATRVFSGADEVTGIPIPTDWGSPGAQFRTGMDGVRCKVRALIPCLCPSTELRQSRSSTGADR